MIDARRTWSLFGFHVTPLLFAALVILTYLDPSLAGESVDPVLRPIDGWWLAAGLVAANALAFRRWYPLGSMAVVTAMLTWVGTAPYTLSPLAWTVYVSAFALGRYASGRHGLGGLALMILSVTLTWFSDQALAGVDVAFIFAFGIMCWLAGRELRRWRDRAELERADADRRVELERQAVLVERQRLELDRRSLELAVAQQRLHMAHELHDVVAHSLGVIAVQAGMADAAFEPKPDEARRAVANIVKTSRSSLTEIRQILGVLREGSDHQSTGHSATPRLADVPQLVAQAEANGLAVTTNLDVPVGLPPGLELSAYRVVQQALTNVIQHADASAVELSITTDGQEMEITVVDNGKGPISPGRPTPGRGYGVVGMGERIAAYGGRLQAAPGPQGGFLVRATVPFCQLTGTQGDHR